MLSEQEMESDFRVLMQLKDLPNNARITKRTGQKVYVVSREMRIFSNGTSKPPQSVKPEDGVVFLIPASEASNNISAVSDTTIVEWHVSEEELLGWLQEREMGRESK